jgi:hypothetical protein
VSTAIGGISVAAARHLSCFARLVAVRTTDRLTIRHELAYAPADARFLVSASHDDYQLLFHVLQSWKKIARYFGANSTL